VSEKQTEKTLIGVYCGYWEALWCCGVRGGE